MYSGAGSFLLSIVIGFLNQLCSFVLCEFIKLMYVVSRSSVVSLFETLLPLLCMNVFIGLMFARWCNCSVL